MRANQVQIADYFGACYWSLLLAVPMGFEKQQRIVQNALPDRHRSPRPGAVELRHLALIATMIREIAAMRWQSSRLFRVELPLRGSHRDHRTAMEHSWR